MCFSRGVAQLLYQRRFEKQPITQFQHGKHTGLLYQRRFEKQPITDRQTASSAEMFLLRMLHHPCTVVVGDNSSGTEVFGNVGSALLPNSQIKFNIGMNYRVLSQENFELNGVTPNIKCPENTDALTVALREIANQQILSQAIKQNSNAL